MAASQVLGCEPRSKEAAPRPPLTSAFHPLRILRALDHTAAAVVQSGHLVTDAELGILPSAIVDDVGAMLDRGRNILISEIEGS